MNVAILGCGPAGLLAAHELVERGHHPMIYSRRVKSTMFGAMYLHQAIPGLTPEEPELKITVIKSGCREGYAENVYGDPSAPVSWDRFEEGETNGWRLKTAYDLLWAKFVSHIVNCDLTQDFIDELEQSYPLLISTVPRNLLCRNPRHHFESQQIHVVHGYGNRLLPGINDNDIMYYNGYTPNMKYGLVGPSWYRFSQIDRYQSWEYRSRTRIAEETVEASGHQISSGKKPLRTDCDCRPNVHKVGRFGKWDKNIFVHHTLEEVSRVVLAMQ